MSLSTAQMARLHDLARELAAAPAGAGERGRLVARAAGELGRSVKTVYALLRRHTDWTSGRRTRARPASAGIWRWPWAASAT